MGIKCAYRLPCSDCIPSMPIITLLGIWAAALLGSELFGRLLATSNRETAKD